jgi:PhnB protein
MNDPFDILRLDDYPVAPRSDFAVDLRSRLINEMETAMSSLPTSPDQPDLDVLNTVTPYLCVHDAAAAIEFYGVAFGAVEHHRMVGDDGRIGHAEIVVGSSRLMLADEYPDIGVLSPTSRGGTSTSFTISVADCDVVVERAVAAGATLVRPVADQFYGHRQGTVLDPFGHQWSISSPLPHYGDDEYDARSKDEGFEVKRPERR